MTALNDWFETRLYRRGFRQPEIRGLVRNQIYLALVSGIVVAAATGFSGWGLGYAAGALLITANFTVLARVAPSLVRVTRGAVAPLLFQFYGRLILTGIAIFVLIAWLNVSGIALLVGTSTVIVNAIIFAAAKAKGHQTKEA